VRLFRPARTNALTSPRFRGKRCPTLHPFNTFVASFTFSAPHLLVTRNSSICTINTAPLLQLLPLPPPLITIAVNPSPPLLTTNHVQRERISTVSDVSASSPCFILARSDIFGALRTHTFYSRDFRLSGPNRSRRSQCPSPEPSSDVPDDAWPIWYVADTNIAVSSSTREQHKHRLNILNGHRHTR
jgi:hypothetical protein